MNRAKLATDGTGLVYGISINCPGCGSWHTLPTVPSHGASWEWNGDLARPTVSPSLLVRSGHYASGLSGPDPKGCACNFQERFPDEEPWPWPCGVCHSFIRDGRIEFLGDCTHALAGQTVDLPEIAE